VVPLLSGIKVNRISGQDLTHTGRQSAVFGFSKYMGMIGQKSPRITGGLRPGTENCKSFKKVLTIVIVAEYLPAFYSPNHDVVQNAGSI